MGFFKDLFIVNEEKQQQAEQPQLKTKVAATQPQPQPQYTAPQPAAANTVANNTSYAPQEAVNVPPVTVPGGNVDRNILEMIKEVIEKSNVPGNDYFELNKIVESQDFKNAIPDENARVIAAYHSLRAQDPKFDKKRIADSIDFYIREVKNEFDNVLKSYNQFVNDKINNPKKRIAELQKRREDLVNKISQLDVEIQTIQADVTKCSAELEAKRTNYDATFQIVVQELENEKNKLNVILP